MVKLALPTHMLISHFNEDPMLCIERRSPAIHFGGFKAYLNLSKSAVYLMDLDLMKEENYHKSALY